MTGQLGDLGLEGLWPWPVATKCWPWPWVCGLGTAGLVNITGTHRQPQITQTDRQTDREKVQLHTRATNVTTRAAGHIKEQWMDGLCTVKYCISTSVQQWRAKCPHIYIVNTVLCVFKSQRNVSSVYHIYRLGLQVIQVIADTTSQPMFTCHSLRHAQEFPYKRHKRSFNWC